MAWTRAAIWASEKRMSMVEAGGKKGVLVGISFRVARSGGAGKAGLPSVSADDILRTEARHMYPYLNIGHMHIGTFGLLLWLAAVIATIVLHRNFVRNGIDADALNVVALVVVVGILGAKTWHELQSIPALRLSMRQIVAPGWHRPLDILGEFL